MKNVSDKIKELRKSANLSQIELADKLGVHFQTVSKWERGVCEPDFAVYGKLAEALGVSLEELWGLPKPTRRISGEFDTVKFGKAIANARKALGESQEQLAAAVGVSSTTVSKWERGLVCPDSDTFLKIVKHFRLQPSELYFAQTDVRTPATAPVRTGNRKKIIIGISCALAVVLAVSVLLICLFTIKEPTSAECNHEYETSLVEATCSKQGYTVHTCKKCGYSYNSDYVAALPHTDSGEWIIDSEATCTAEGSRHRECAVCHTTIAAEPIKKLEHTYGAITTVAATCTQQGYDLQICNGCGYEHKSNYTPLATHEYEVATVGSTCAAQGYDIFTCKHCGYSYQANYKPTVQHTDSGEWIVDKEATCTNAGNSHTECTVCHAVIAQKTIPLLPHDYETQIIPPNATEEGYTLHTCRICGYSYSDSFVPPDEKYRFYEFDYSSMTCAVKNVDEDIGPRFEIPSEVNGCKVTAIAGNAFEDCVNLREIVIPNAVTRIGMSAFHRCAMLENVVIPDSVTEMGEEAFCGCRNLKSAVLPSKITRLKYSVFSDCTSLQSIQIPDTVTVIEDLAFNNCYNLAVVKLPAKLTYIGLYAFNCCRSLERIEIPESTAYIGGNAFRDCENLQQMIFEDPDGWTVDGNPVDMSDSKTVIGYFSDVYRDEAFIKEQ